MRRTFFVLIASFSFVACGPPPVEGPAPNYSTDSGVTTPTDAGTTVAGPRVQVRQVIDGDTIILTATSDAKTPDGRNLSGETVRLLGVDAPEVARPPQTPTSDCYGDEARADARDLMQGRTVTLAYGTSNYRDTYGRLLAYVVFSNGEIANETLIENGSARSYDRFSHRYRSRFEAAEKRARDQNLGVWTCR